MTLQAFVANWGYLAVLVGTFFEGETIAVLGGLAARQEMLELPVVMLVAFAGSLCGDQLAFFIGRRFGGRWLARHPSWQPRMERAHAIIERHRNWLMLSFRFFYGLRNVMPFAFGMSRVKASRFATFNVIGAAIWAVASVGAGFVFGAAVELVIADVKRYQQWLLGGLALLAASIWLFRQWRLRRAAAARKPSVPPCREGAT